MRTFGSILLAALALAAATPAAAQSNATVSFTFPGCTQPAIQGTSPNFSVICASGLVCLANATPTTQTPGTPVQLQVVCSPDFTSVVWQPSRDCTAPTPGAGGVATANEAVGNKNCVYTATASNATSQQTGVAQVQVAWTAGGGGGGPTAPTGCSVTATPTTLGSGGGGVSLGVSCSGGGTPTAWTWRRNQTTPYRTTQGFTDTLGANTGTTPIVYTYGATVCAGTACAAEVTRQVTVDPPPVGGGDNLCGQFNNVVTKAGAWNSNANSANDGGLLGTGVYAVSFTVPTTLPDDNDRGMINVFGSGFDFRQATLSKHKCDFRTPDPTGANGPLARVSSPTSVTLDFYVPNSPLSPRLERGQSYWINIRNYNPINETWSCAADTICDARTEWTVP